MPFPYNKVARIYARIPTFAARKIINTNYMKNQLTKGSYLTPETEVIALQTEVVFCASVQANMSESWGVEEDI